MMITDLLDLGPYITLALGASILGGGWWGVALVGVCVLVALWAWLMRDSGDARYSRNVVLERRGVCLSDEPAVGDDVYIDGEYVGKVVEVKKAKVSSRDWDELCRMARGGWN